MDGNSGNGLLLAAPRATPGFPGLSEKLITFLRALYSPLLRFILRAESDPGSAISHRLFFFFHACGGCIKRWVLQHIYIKQTLGEAPPCSRGGNVYHGRDPVSRTMYVQEIKKHPHTSTTGIPKRI